ncbi:MAG: NHL repeat-containing protein [Spirochaetia bacterium]|nr:NHL repeat-containing protein [Spirochaetia bacterium]
MYGRRGIWKYALILLVLGVMGIHTTAAQEDVNTIDMDQVYAERELRYGIRAFHRGEYNKALLSLEKSLSLKPGFSLAQSWLARTYYRNGFTSTAIDMWSRMMEDGGLSAAMEQMVRILTYQREQPTEPKEGPKFVEFEKIEGIQNDVQVFKRPTAVHPNSTGGFYTVSFATNEVLEFSANGGLKRSLRGGIEGLNHPFDITANPDEGLFITEFAGDRIVHCTPTGRVLKRFGQTGTGQGQLLGPQFISDDKNGYLYVTDQGNRRVAKFDYEGNFILSFGRKTADFEGFQQPTGILAHEDFVYVADKNRSAVDVFDASGNFLVTLTSSYLKSPEGLSLYSSQQLIIADEEQVLLLDLESRAFTPLSRLNGRRVKIVSASRDVNDNLLIADFNQNIVSMQADFSRMYSGLFVRINRVNAENFPEVFLDITVQRRTGEPYVGLEGTNFYITEARYPVEEPVLESAVDRLERADITLMVEGSPGMQQNTEGIGQAAADIASSLLRRGDINVVQAGSQPVLQLEAAQDGEAVRSAALSGSFSQDWQFDQGLRLSAGPLISGGEKRAIVFLSTGKLPEHAFQSYELIHLLDYLRNNDITFNCVTMNPQGKIAPELAYLCEKTGGSSTYLYNPRGVAPMVERILEHSSGRYILSYRSTRNSDFGRAYLPVEAQISVFGRSGRGELGYFAPPE